VKMTKKIRKGPVYMPMDVLKIDSNQRYNTKLSDTQTSNMIKFAVTLPKERWAAVQHGVRLLNWPNDPYLRHYGLQVNLNASKVKARVLPSPQVHFGQGSKDAQLKPADMVAGRWRLDGLVKRLVLTYEYTDTYQTQVCREQQGPSDQGLGCLLSPGAGSCTSNAS
jgi:eukaryotic translation initiation factor 2C